MIAMGKNESEETEVKDMEELKSWFEDDKLYVGEYVKHKIDQLEESEVSSQELPVIPKYVADYIDDRKEMDFPIYQAIRIVRENSRFEHSHLREWLWTNKGQEVFARAWLDGYAVEEEQKYYVINNENYFLLAKDKAHGFVFSTGGNSRLGGLKNSSVKFELTEQEIKGYDERYWAFRKPVEVAE